MSDIHTGFPHTKPHTDAATPEKPTETPTPVIEPPKAVTPVEPPKPEVKPEPPVARAVQQRVVPAGAPLPPQQRKQIADKDGNFTPVPHDPPQRRKAVVEPEEKPLRVGDFVQVTGRVLEIQSTQGGQVSVKVQLNGDAGVTWMQGGHLTKVDK